MAIVRKLSELDQGKFEESYKEVVQLWEAISPHPKLRDHRTKYLWLNEIYEIYLEEFKRLDFDAEIYAAKTRKLIQDSAKLINFKGHLPEISIDSNYLDKLKETKLDPADKAEKIIRDIETVIRQNEANSAIYVEFQNRLDELIKQKQEESKSIEVILENLSSLYSELDEVATLPQRMGFPDKGTFEIFTLIKNNADGVFNEALTRDFSEEVVETVIKKKIYIGWQDVPKELDRLKVNIEIFAASDRYQELEVDENEELMEHIMKTVEKNYKID
jgi:type I restriction enzyme R subunit